MKRWLKISLSSLFTLGILILLISVEKTQDNNTSTPGLKIRIEIKDQNAFLTKEDLKSRLHAAQLIYPNQTFEELETEKIENFVSSISHVKSVSVYRSGSEEWIIDVELRKPIARIYNKYGENFYLGDEGHIMSKSNTFTANAIIVTGEIKDRRNSASVNYIINSDSLKSIRKLDDIYRISNYVCNDPFFQSLIGQINLEKNGDFILVPIIGRQKIVFGTAYTEKDVADKFKKLKIFYEEAIQTEGWNKYTEISLKYKDQIVCKKVNV